MNNVPAIIFTTRRAVLFHEDQEYGNVCLSFFSFSSPLDGTFTNGIGHPRIPGSVPVLPVGIVLPRQRLTPISRMPQLPPLAHATSRGDCSPSSPTLGDRCTSPDTHPGKPNGRTWSTESNTIAIIAVTNADSDACPEPIPDQGGASPSAPHVSNPQSPKTHDSDVSDNHSIETGE